MKWEELQIEQITVDLLKGQIHINDNTLILIADYGQTRAMGLAYVVAYATKYAPVHPGFKGLTWWWLKENLRDFAGWRILCNGNTARTVWNQNCLSPHTWKVCGSDVPTDNWFEAGRTWLKKLFVSEPLDKEQRYYSGIKHYTHRMHFPDEAVVSVLPDGADLGAILKVTEFPPHDRTRDKYSPESVPNYVSFRQV